MEYPNDEWKPSADDAYDPAVDDAIAKHKVEAPDAYDNTGVLSRPSRSSRPQLTEGVLRDMRRHGGGGAGYSGSTPINPQQLKSEAQTRAFFRRAGQGNPSTQINPYQVTDDAQALQDFYNPRDENGALTGERFNPPTEYSDTTLAASNEAWNAVPHKRGTMSERSIPHINPYQPDPFTKKRSGETSISDLDRQEKSLAWMADPKNNKGRTEFQQYESSPAEVNPQIAYSQKLANQKAYASAMVNKRNKKVEKNSPSSNLTNSLYLDPRENRANDGEGNINAPKVDSENKPLQTDRSTSQSQINYGDRGTWKRGQNAMSSEEARLRDKKLGTPSTYYSVKENRWIDTNEFDQPQHTETLAELAFKNQNLGNRDNYLSDLKNSIQSELLGNYSRNLGPFDQRVGNGKDFNPDQNTKIAIDKMAEDMLEMEYYKNILKNGQASTLGRTDQQINDHLINLKNRYEQIKRSTKPAYQKLR
jgi:hypothetical protein